MAKRGSNKYKSIVHEDFIAKAYNGVRSPSSGADETDAGDVRCPNLLIECKATGNPADGKNVKPVFIKHLEKVTEEAWEEGKVGAVALRYWDRDSILADKQGYIDVIVKRVADDSQD